MKQIGSVLNPSPNSQLLSPFAAQATTPVAANKRTFVWLGDFPLKKSVFHYKCPPWGLSICWFLPVFAAGSEWSWALRGDNDLSDWVLLFSAAQPYAASCVALNLQLSRRRNHYYFTHRHSLLDFQNARNIWNIFPPLHCRNHRGTLIEFHSHAVQKLPLDISF